MKPAAPEQPVWYDGVVPQLDAIVTEYPSPLLLAHAETGTSITTRYYGIQVQERTLVPDDNARLGKIRFDDWLAQGNLK